MPEAPTGTVTFLFTDIEGSTTRWEHHPDAMRTALARHDTLLRQIIPAHNGFVFKMVGDAVYAAFAIPADAVSAALAAQQAVVAEEWGEVGPLRVRMALHTGAAQSRDDDYFGPTLNRVARVLSTGYGGQILLSLATLELARDALPTGASVKDLGEHALKDLLRPEHIFQLCILDLPSEFPPLKSLTHQTHNLPVQPTPFLGREQEVAAVCNLLHRPEVRLVTLTGPGGIGKTRLGLQVAAELADLFADGVFLVPLAPVSDPKQVVPTSIQTLGISEAGGQPPLALLKTALKDKHMLLLLDNFEQVVDAAVVVAEVLTACPKLTMLVTSRVVLRVQAEREFALPPLSMPNLKRLPDLGALSQYESVALFIQRAQAVKADFAVTNTNAPAVAAICARLDGLPLAIELAAARIKYFPPQALLSRLEQGLSVLSGGARDLPVRQQTLRGTIAWSYDLLTQEEQKLFRRLSIFVNGCTWEAVEVVCRAAGELEGDVLDGLLSLVDKSLLRQEESTEGEPRFWMLQLLREFGREALAIAGETELTRQGHALYYLALAEEAEPELEQAQQAVWLDRLEAEYDNLRAALLWSLEHAKAETGLRLAGALRWFWMRRSHLSEGRTWLTSMLGLAEGVEPTHLRAKALAAASGLAWLQGDYPAASAFGEESVTLCRALENKRELAFSLMWLACTASSQGDPKTASVLAEESVTFFRQVEDRWELALALNVQGNATHRLQDYSLARSCYEESLALSRALGDKWCEALSLGSLGVSAFVHTEYAQARPLLEEGVVLMRAQRDKRDLAFFLYYLGRLRRHEGNNQQAMALFEESLAHYEELGNKPGIARLLWILGKMDCDKGDYGQAGAHLNESLALMQEIKNLRGIASVLEGFATLTMLQQQAKLAARLLGAVGVLREAIGAPLPPDERADYEQTLAAARTALGEEAFARAWAEGRATPLEQTITDVLKMGS